jgi:hypothetical protein
MRTITLTKEWGGHPAGAQVVALGPGEVAPDEVRIVDAGRAAQLLADGLAEADGAEPLPRHEAQVLGHRQAEPGESAPTWTADSARKAPAAQGEVGSAVSTPEAPAQPQGQPEAAVGVPGAQEPPVAPEDPPADPAGGRGTLSPAQEAAAVTRKGAR